MKALKLLLTALLPAVCAFNVLAAAGSPLVPGRFGLALDAGRDRAIVMSRDPYGEPPLTVECWVKLRSATGRNDILCSERPDSGEQWTLFTTAGAGEFGVALPGYAPTEILSTRNIADGAWHHLAMILEPARVRLYVDAREVAVRELARDPGKRRAQGWLLIGGAVDQPESKCDGLIDEVRITRGVRPITRIPDAPPAADPETVGLWRMDAIGAAREIADASTLSSEAYLTKGRSMDEIDRLSFKAGPAPLDLPAQTVVLLPGAAQHPEPVKSVTIGPDWRMADGGARDERLKTWSDGIPATVPGSVHSALVAAGKIPDPKFGRNDAIAHNESFKTWWFKYEFPRPPGVTGGRLVFDGVAIHCTVWLNGLQLGEHEGMFGGPSYEVAGLLRDQNSLLVEVEPAPGDPQDWNNRAWNSTVVFNNTWGWHYSSIAPLGIWRAVRLEGSPVVRVANPFVVTHDATAGDVSLLAEMQGTAGGWSGTLTATVEPDNFTGPSYHFTQEVKATSAIEKLHLRFKIPNPRLWWPNDLGEQNLYRLKLSFAPDGGGLADVRETTFGVRTIEMAPLPDGLRFDQFNWTFVINGRPIFVKGTGWCTMDSSMDFSRARYARFISLAKLQHVQMFRAWGSGMPETDEFYDQCDRAGIMVYQEWPTFGRSHRVQPYDVLEETVRLNIPRLRGHPSLAMWGGGNESMDPFSRAIDMMGRLAIELDGTRAFHRAEPWGGSEHNYDCYWGYRPLDHNLQMIAPFWGEFGLATVPVLESVQRYLPETEKNLWPAPADGSFLHHTPIFNTRDDLKRLSQYSGYFSAGATMADFIRGSQLSQVVGLRHPLERARTRWPESVGALYYKMNDNYPAASWACVDWYGAPKLAHWFCQQAFAPLHAAVVFDHVNNQGRALALPVFLLDDADALKGTKWEVSIRAYDGKLQLIKAVSYTGSGSITAPHRLGEFALTAEQTDTTPLFVVAEVKKNGALADRTFYFVNYEAVKDSLFKLPRTTLDLKIEPGVAIITNTGPLPAVAVAVQRPGHLDTFTAGENELWLEPGETKHIPVSDTEGLTVEAWNK
jgi:beta-mannosidase